MKEKINAEMMQEIKSEFDTLSGEEQWTWLATTNHKQHFTLFLDNDDTHIYFDDDEEADYVLRFRYYAGNGFGTLYLLKSIGIKAEHV